jgi:hypothetical protein
MIQNKKGSHVGMIISFAIFIIFLVFLLVILEPTLKISEEKENILDNMGALLEDYLKSELTTATVQINLGVNIAGNCVKFEDLEIIDEAEFGGRNIFIKNAAETILGHDWAAPDLSASNDGANRFFKIYASSAIDSSESTLVGCRNIEDDEYIYGITKTEKNIFEKNIITAMELYESDYEILLENIGISEEFGFDFTYNNGTTISTGESEQNKNVYAKEIPIIYIDNSLNSKIGSITIKTW